MRPDRSIFATFQDERCIRASDRTKQPKRVAFKRLRLANAGCLPLYLLFSLICFASMARPSLAQYSSGVDGTIQDSSGAIVAGATVELTDLNLGVSKSARSNDAGYFRILSAYRVLCTACCACYVLGNYERHLIEVHRVKS